MFRARVLPAAVAVLASLPLTVFAQSTVLADAVDDAKTAVAAFNDPILTVGVAVLAIIVTIKGIKWLRRSL